MHFRFDFFHRIAQAHDHNNVFLRMWRRRIGSMASNEFSNKNRKNQYLSEKF